MAKAKVTHDVVKVTLELTYTEASALFELLDDAQEQDVLSSTELPIYEALREVLI